MIYECRGYVVRYELTLTYLVHGALPLHQCAFVLSVAMLRTSSHVPACMFPHLCSPSVACCSCPSIQILVFCKCPFHTIAHRFSRQWAPVNLHTTSPRM